MNKYVNEINNDVLLNRYNNINPAILKNGEFFVIEKPSFKKIDSVAYLWSPKVVRKANNLTPVFKTKIYCSYAYYGFFKPLFSEVLSFLTDEHETEVNCVIITKSPETTDDLNKEKEALNAGYHVAEATFYWEDNSV